MSDLLVMLLLSIGMVVLYVGLGALMIKIGRGYNSLSRAMASLEAQNFAARYFGRKFILFSLIFGLPTIILSIVAFVTSPDGGLITVVFWIQMTLIMLPPIVCLVLTELKLRRHFDKNGRPYK